MHLLVDLNNNLLVNNTFIFSRDGKKIECANITILFYV